MTYTSLSVHIQYLLKISSDRFIVSAKSQLNLPYGIHSGGGCPATYGSVTFV